MTMNPQDYDPQELRKAARHRSIRDLRQDLAAETEGNVSLSEAQLKELIMLQAGADPAELERPYLGTVPDQYAARLTLFEWLDFVLREVGSEATQDLLQYYVDIGWLSESAAEELRDHVRVFEGRNPQEPQRALENADHLVSLVYIARLASMA